VPDSTVESASQGEEYFTIVEVPDMQEGVEEDYCIPPSKQEPPENVEVLLSEA